MAIVLRESTRTDIADLVADEVDVGSTNSQGQLVFLQSNDNVVALVPLNNPAFGDASAGVATADVSPQPQDTNTAGGTVAKFELQDRDESTVISGTAGDVGSEDIVLTSATIGVGETLTLVSMTYTAPDAAP